QGSDLAAFRTRAFALAIVGKSDEAVSIAETMLPERISSRIAPYLRYMPRLARAQRRCAAHAEWSASRRPQRGWRAAPRDFRRAGPRRRGNPATCSAAGPA